MNRLNKRPYDTFANGPKAQTVRELQEFGDEASRRLPNLGRDRSNARDGGGGVEVAHSDPGEWAGGVVGGWLGRRLTKRFGAGGQLGGALVGQYLGEKVGAGLGAMLGGPVPESVARGVMTPAERDYPGYWGYSGDDAVGGWQQGPRQEKAVAAEARGLPNAYADRIAQDFGNEWGDAYEIYGQNPDFWNDAYQGDPRASKGGPKSALVPRTSRLPPAPGNGRSPDGGGFWDDRFPGRSSLREAQGRWRE